MSFIEVMRLLVALGFVALLVERTLRTGSKKKSVQIVVTKSANGLYSASVSGKGFSYYLATPRCTSADEAVGKLVVMYPGCFGADISLPQ